MPPLGEGELVKQRRLEIQDARSILNCYPYCQLRSDSIQKVTFCMIDVFRFHFIGSLISQYPNNPYVWIVHRDLISQITNIKRVSINVLLDACRHLFILFVNIYLSNWENLDMDSVLCVFKVLISCENQINSGQLNNDMELYNKLSNLLQLYLSQ